MYLVVQVNVSANKRTQKKTVKVAPKGQPLLFVCYRCVKWCRDIKILYC